jgi:hypothetical protein
MTEPDRETKGQTGGIHGPLGEISRPNSEWEAAVCNVRRDDSADNKRERHDQKSLPTILQKPAPYCTTFRNGLCSDCRDTDGKARAGLT